MKAHLFRRRLSGRFPPSNPTPPGDPVFPLSQGALLPRLPPQRGTICLEYHRRPLRSPSGAFPRSRLALRTSTPTPHLHCLLRIWSTYLSGIQPPPHSFKSPLWHRHPLYLQGKEAKLWLCSPAPFSPSWPLGFLARTTTAPAYCCLFFTAQLFSFYLKRP